MTSRWRVLATGNDSKITRERQQIVANQADWQVYWGEHTGTKSLPPRIDFDQEWIAALHLGTRATTGYDLIVTSVDPIANGGLGIAYMERQPAQGQLVDRVATTPYSVVRIPRFLGQVFFDRRIWDNSGG
jgi:hypothetical protein